MANEIASVKLGLTSLLSGIKGLRVFDYPKANINQLPAAVVLFESRDGVQTPGGTTFTGWLKVTILVASTGAGNALKGLEAFLDPAGDSSIESAVNADPTWGGTVDNARLVLVDNVGRRCLSGGRYIGADLHFEFVKRVAES